MHLKLEEKMKSLGSFIFDNPIKVISAILVSIALFASSKIELSHNPLYWF